MRDLIFQNHHRLYRVSSRKVVKSGIIKDPNTKHQSYLKPGSTSPTPSTLGNCSGVARPLPRIVPSVPLTKIPEFSIRDPRRPRPDPYQVIHPPPARRLETPQKPPVRILLKSVQLRLDKHPHLPDQPAAPLRYGARRAGASRRAPARRVRQLRVRHPVRVHTDARQCRELAHVRRHDRFRDSERDAPQACFGDVLGLREEAVGPVVKLVGVLVDAEGAAMTEWGEGLGKRDELLGALEGVVGDDLEVGVEAVRGDGRLEGLVGCSCPRFGGGEGVGEVGSRFVCNLLEKAVGMWELKRRVGDGGQGQRYKYLLTDNSQAKNHICILHLAILLYHEL